MLVQTTKTINRSDIVGLQPLIDHNVESCDSLNHLIDVICGDRPGISGYWRKNTSSNEAIELANILRALNKVVGLIGRNAGQVEWAGMSSNTKGSIVLDPNPLTGDYPVSTQKFDYLVGVVVHKALHHIEWSNYLWKKIHEKISDMKMSEKIIFHKIIDRGEDIYIDSIADRSILGRYTQIVRKVAVKKQSFFPKTDRIFVDMLVHRWWQASFGDYSTEGDYSTKGDYSTEIDDAYTLPLKILSTLKHELVKVGSCNKGVVERCKLRSNLYIETFETIKGVISSWEIFDKTLCWYPELPRNEIKRDQRKPRNQSHLSKSTIQNIEERLAHHSSDITPIIRSIAGYDNEDIVPTSRWDFNIPAHPIIDVKLVARLKCILQNYSDRRTILNRGLTAGRVDRRKLYRAPISGRCFMEKQKIPHLDWDICFLIDASGSMNNSKWRMVENTLGTVHRSFSGFENRLQAFAYFEVEGICMISNLIKEKRLLSIPPCGQTASGQAIIAAAHFLPENKRRRFIIHITDGESNFGCDVQFGIDHCRDKHIHLVTLGVAYKDRDSMEKQYGKTIQFVDHFGQLPSAIENLLKWTFLNSKKTAS